MGQFFKVNLQSYSFDQYPSSPGTSMILLGAFLLVLIILGGVLWVAIRRK